MQHASARYDPLIRRVLERLHAQGQVLLQFLLQTVVDVTRGYIFALLAKEGRIVDGKEHRHGRLVDGNRRQSLWILGIAQCVANLKLLQADDGTDVATAHAFGADVGHTLERVEFLDLGLLHCTVAMGNRHLHTVLQFAAMHATYGDTALITGVVETRDQHLGRAIKVFRRGNHLNDLIQQISNVVRRRLPVLTHPAVLGRTVDDGEVQLVFRRIEREHQVEHHLVDFLRATVGLVHLVHHHDGLQANLEGLLQHEARLGHRALEGIDEQQTAVGHIQHALHLAAEVGVSRRINDIDLHPFPGDTHILRKDRDAALTLQVVGVEHLAAQVLSLTEEISCQHHLVHERRLAVVYVRNNCDISDILHT